MIKKDELNVLTYGYDGRFGFRHVKQFFRNIKYAYQRIRYGFCDQDIWNLDYYYAALFYKTLNSLADNTCGYPGVGEFSDENGGFEAWQTYLREMAWHFANTLEENEGAGKIAEEASDRMNSFIKSMEIKDSYLVYEYTDKEKYEEAKDEWLEASKDNWNFREDEKNKALEMLKKVWYGLWD